MRISDWSSDVCSSDLLPHVRFGANVVGARYDEAAALWRVETQDGRKFSGRVLVSGLGALSNPSIPKIPGLAEFDGKLFHSAQWDPASDLNGKRIAVIGTGASESGRASWRARGCQNV